jgi:hypothetical protein
MKKQPKTINQHGAVKTPKPKRAGKALALGLGAATVFTPLVTTGCPTEVEYRTEYVETSHEFVFKDVDGNDTVYLNFTDEAYKIVKNKPGQLAQFSTYINGDISHNEFKEYFKSKGRLDVCVTDFTYTSGQSYHIIGTEVIVINVRNHVNDNNIADRLISALESGIGSLPDYTPPSSAKKANDSHIHMADAVQAPQKGKLWKQLEDARSRNTKQIAANSRSRAYGNA